MAAVASKLEQGALKANTMRGPLIEISVDMMKTEEAVFASQGRRGGGSWKPLKPETIKRKGNSLILIESGELRASLTHPGAKYQILRIGNNEIEFGTARPGAGAHQRGSKSQGLPARPFLRFTGYDESRWIRILTSHLMEPFSYGE